jgi:FKBP-type peptidyl-prolyl cis-trans isomerase FkpA
LDKLRQRNDENEVKAAKFRQTGIIEPVVTALRMSGPYWRATFNSLSHRTFMTHIRLICAFALQASLAGFAMADNPKSETLPSGVVIEHLKEGTGAAPTVNDTVVAHYRGTLVDGKEFDSSYKRGEPAAFPLTRVVPCWTQGMQKIRVGGKARLTCPSATAYGDRGIPGAIPGGAVLIFEVELVSIKK